MDVITCAHRGVCHSFRCALLCVILTQVARRFCQSAQVHANWCHNICIGACQFGLENTGNMARSVMGHSSRYRSHFGSRYKLGCCGNASLLLYFGAVFEPPRGHPDTKRASAITAARLLSAFARASAHCQLARGAMLTGSARLQTCCARQNFCGPNKKKPSP